MVCSKLHLKAIRRSLPARQRHDSRIVYQEIKGLPGVNPLREVGDRCKAGQIELFVAYPGADHFVADLLDSRPPLPIVATGQNDFRTGLGQGQGRLVTEAARCPGDNGCSAELRRDFGLCRTSHGGTCSRGPKGTITFGSAGFAGWWGGSGRLQSPGRRYFWAPRTANPL